MDDNYYACTLLADEIITNLTSDHFEFMSDHLSIISLIQCIGCPTKLNDNMAIDSFCPIISKNL